MRTMIAGLIALVVFSTAGLAQQLTFAQQKKRLKLWEDCKPMDLLVVGLNEDAKKIGLTERILRLRAERHLRSARLYSEDKPSASLHVSVNVVGAAFSISLKFRKWVVDTHGHVAQATTWDNSITGTHGRDPRFIASTLSELMDSFLVEYLRTNEDACEK